MPSISYEVSAKVREDLTAAFETYMTDVHIPDVMATGAFLSSNFALLETGRYRTTYITGSRESLETYLADQAKRLREHVVETFPEGIQFSREEWTILASF